jgi:MoaA/NifB/PqqE/SkfB family radical SAM enzyme
VNNRDLESLFGLWKERIHRLIKEHPLQIITWEATRRCNLKCKHCGTPHEDALLEKELTTDEVIEIFEQIASDFDMSQFRHINITGGEPFVRMDLLFILKAISKYPFYRNIDIQTNGIFIAEHPEVLKELKHYGVTGIGVSIDGFEETHDNFRGVKGAFEKAVKSAKLAVEEGYVVTVSLVVHAKNIIELPEFFNFVKNEIKPRVFRVMFIDPIGRAGFNSEYLLSPSQMKMVVEFLRKEYTKSCMTYADPKTTIVELGCGGWAGKELEGTFRPFIFHCIAGINNLGILYDGKIASCNNISRAFVEDFP